MNQIANLITILRILGVGFIFWLTPYTSNFMLITVVIIYIIVAVTDFLDGWIARRLKIVSEVGQVLDPLADKIMVLLFLPLLEMQVITSFPVFIILAREFTMMGLRIFSVQKGTGSIPAQFAGKLKTAVTLPVCGILFGRVAVEQVPLPYIYEPIEWLRLWVLSWPNGVMLGLVYSVVAITVWSLVDYFDHFVWDLYLKRWNNDEFRARQALRALVPNFFSILNLGLGCLAIYFTVQYNFSQAALLLVVCVVLDAIDGSIARRLNAQTTFGSYLDSLADFVSFGILPSVVIYFYLGQFTSGVFAFSMAALYGFSVAYRLVRFMSVGHSRFFQGIPSPFSASIVIFSVISVLFSPHPIFLGVIFLMILLMVSKLPYPHRQEFSKRRFLRFVQFPAFVFTLLSIAMLVRGQSGFNFFVYDILIMIFCLYIITPLVYGNDFNEKK